MRARALGFHPVAHDWIRNDFLKAIHAALLAELPPGKVLEFWKRHPLTLFKGPLPPKSFLRYLWGPEPRVPPLYFWSVIGDLESFLHSNGIAGDGFFRLLNQGAAGGPPLDPGRMLDALPPPEGAEAPLDPREWVLSGLPELARDLFPGCRMESISPAGGPERSSRLFLFQPLPRTERYPIPDFGLFPGKMLTALPRLLGCSDFDRLEVLADMRGPGPILEGVPEPGWHWEEEVLRLGAKRMGRLLPLEECIAEWPEADALRRALPRSLQGLVLRMERDFAQPGPGRRLRAGCVYGSPVFLARIGYAPSRRWRRLASLLQRKPPALPEPRASWELAEILHRELLASLPE